MSTLTSQGQVTIPKPIRDALQPRPGMSMEFAVNAAGEVVIHPARTARAARRRAADRLDAVRGKADVRWRTEDLMKLLRSDD
jgi:AbrB family looped-hinge helix DNA binding protein